MALHTQVERQKIIHKLKDQLDVLNQKLDTLEDKAYLVREDAQELYHDLRASVDTTVSRFKRVVSSLSENVSKTLDQEWKAIRKDAEELVDSVEETLELLKDDVQKP